METQSSAVFWLSPQQKRAWLTLENTTPNTACVIRISQPVPPEQLREVLRRLTNLHEALRTVYRFLPGVKVPFQEVCEAAEPAWELADLSALQPVDQQNQLDALFQEHLRHRFDLEHGPALRAQFVRLDLNSSALILSVHPLTADSVSLITLIREAARICAGDDPPPEAIRPTQFAQWQNDLLTSDDENAQKAKEYWLRDLGSPLALASADSTGQSAFRPQTVATVLEDSLVGEIERLAEQKNSSPADVLLTAWQCILGRLTGQRTFYSQVFFDGREYEELESAVGVIGKFLPLPAKLDGDFSFQDILEDTRRVFRDALQWQEYFSCEDKQIAGAFGFEFVDLRIKSMDAPFTVERLFAGGERFNCKLSVQRTGHEMRVELGYDAAKLDLPAARRWLNSFSTLLKSAVADPRGAARTLPLLTESERRVQLEDWNQTSAEYPRDRPIQELFELQAARTPDRTAVRSGEVTLSYRELNERANRLAHHLRRAGVRPESLVALCVSRGADMIVGLLGILKAEAGYVPMNLDSPKKRLAQQLSEVAAVVTESALLPQLPQLDCVSICLEALVDGGDEASRSNLAVSTTPEHIAYVIFTSGSTGVPKGVCVRHRNLVNYATFISRLLGLEQHPNGLHFATVSTLNADLGNTCIFPALLSGGTLHVISQSTAADTALFANYQRKHAIDVLKIVPSHLEALLGDAEAADILPRKYLILGGESLTPRLVTKISALGPACELINHYGPTETTVGSLTLRLADYRPAGPALPTIPIGRPISNTQIYILDPYLQPVPIGVAGELFISGDGVAAGYLNQPELTHERFIDNPFRTGRMYRTGDQARYDATGTVEFLGRSDDQVKVRGFRIELGEIETALLAHSAVKQATVAARPDTRGDKQIVAYVVTQRDKITADELRTHLKESLPDYMLPAAFVFLPKLPLNANGKIDRQNLPEPEQVQARIYVAPRNAMEQDLAGIWADVFGSANISVQDNFFEIGGHSLMATQVLSRVRERFQVALDMHIIFDNPTVAKMAEAIDAARENQAASDELEITPVDRESYRKH